jgi:putative two-component system response regulator
MVMAEAGTRRILVVDDNRHVAQVLEQLLAAEGHAVEVASDGVEALERVALRPPDLVLLDLDMPRLNGFEVCRRLKSDTTTRHIPVIIVTAQSAFQTKIQAWELGADDFLSKPFQRVEVLARCRCLLRLKGLIEERDSAEAVVFALARAVEAKSPYTHGHSERVKDYALRLAARAGLPESEWALLGKGALLHDIGKISTPDAILNKAGPLTPEEFAIVKDHTWQGAHIVEPLHSMHDAVPLIRWHHERMDGRGYPDSLPGEQIPFLVRILAVADVYDSLASDRPYRQPIPHAVCLEMLRNNAAGGGLDPELVEYFCAVMEDGLISRSRPSASRQIVATSGSLVSSQPTSEPLVATKVR